MPPQHGLFGGKRHLVSRAVKPRRKLRGHLARRPGSAISVAGVACWRASWSCLSCPPFELGTIGPEGVQQDGKFTGHGDLRPLEADPLDKAHAPGPQR